MEFHNTSISREKNKIIQAHVPQPPSAPRPPRFSRTWKSANRSTNSPTHVSRPRSFFFGFRWTPVTIFINTLHLRHTFRSPTCTILLPTGVDHLLPGEEPPSETKMACFMVLLMQLADKPEVLRVSPTHKGKLLNSAASAVVQSATTTDTPLLDAGLDGQGEVIQVRCLRCGRPGVGRRIG